MILFSPTGILRFALCKTGYNPDKELIVLIATLKTFNDFGVIIIINGNEQKTNTLRGCYSLFWLELFGKSFLELLNTLLFELLGRLLLLIIILIVIEKVHRHR